MLVSRHPELIEFARAFRNYGKPDYGVARPQPAHERVHRGARRRAAERLPEIVACKNRVAREHLDPLHEHRAAAARRDDLGPLQVHRLRPDRALDRARSTTSRATASSATTSSCRTRTGSLSTTGACRSTTRPTGETVARRSSRSEGPGHRRRRLHRLARRRRADRRAATSRASSTSRPSPYHDGELDTVHRRPDRPDAVDDAAARLRRDHPPRRDRRRRATSPQTRPTPSASTPAARATCSRRRARRERRARRLRAARSGSTTAATPTWSTRTRRSACRATSTRPPSSPARCTARSYAELYGVDYTILRFGIPYGPRARAGGGDPDVLQARRSPGEPLTIAGGGKQSRRFIYVEDLADGVVAALAPEARNRVYNLAARRRSRSASWRRGLGDRRRHRRSSTRRAAPATSAAPRSRALVSRASSAGVPRPRWRRGSGSTTGGSRPRRRSIRTRIPSAEPRGDLRERRDRPPAKSPSSCNGRRRGAGSRRPDRARAWRAARCGPAS